MRKTDFALLIVGVAIFLAPIPLPEAALGDDMIYKTSVSTLLYEGRIDLHQTANTFLLLLFYGTALAHIIPISLLHATIIPFTIGSLLLFYRILESYTKRPIFYTMILAFNPIFVISSKVFITDIPALFFILLSFWLILKQKRSYAVVAGICGWLIKQISFIVVAAQGLDLLFQKKWKSFIIILIIALPIILLSIYFASWSGSTYALKLKLDAIANLNNLGKLFYVVGFSIFPISIYTIYKMLYLKEKITCLRLLAYVAIILFFLAWAYGHFGKSIPGFLIDFHPVLALMALTSAPILINGILKAAKTDRLLFLVIALNFGVIFIEQNLDRYFLPMLSFVILSLTLLKTKTKTRTWLF